jgi:hypothetical protein
VACFGANEEKWGHSRAASGDAATPPKSVLFPIVSNVAASASTVASPFFLVTAAAPAED